jgi:hypothetical protein
LLGLLFDSEYGDDMFLRNVDLLSPNNRRYITEDRTCQRYSFKNPKSKKVFEGLPGAFFVDEVLLYGHEK